MRIDYEQIRTDNERRYGTDIGRIGPLLLANRYDDQTHFIFELLQNAEDALRRRGPAWTGERRVSFKLNERTFELSHFGLPFIEADVRGICGIAESTKADELTTIGRFGIGFKSVYSYSNRPEVHSGENHFAIENFVWPREVEMLPLSPEETRFIFPLRQDRPNAFNELKTAFRKLGCRSLLFLRHIEEVIWEVEGKVEGRYLRQRSPDESGSFCTISVVGQAGNHEELEAEDFIVFERNVYSNGNDSGAVEIAFQTKPNANSDRIEVKAAANCTLVVFFPTVVPTYTGFLIQGPFRTTPSRDNIPKDDVWNRHLITEVSQLLVTALRALRDRGALNAAVLKTMPIEPASFSPDKLLSAMFDTTKDAFRSDDLIPTANGGYARASSVRLGRSQDLRSLLDAEQLTNLLNAPCTLNWAADDISGERAPELRRYLLQELGIEELRTEDIVPKLRTEFLMKQSDSWVVKLYTFMAGQTALLRQTRVTELPWIRLETGEHVRAIEGSKRLAFLSGEDETDFPTVRRSVAQSAEALRFLQALGVTTPDPVDDIIANVLPLYRSGTGCELQIYSSHISRIVRAYATDSKKRQDSLLKELKSVPFVLAKTPLSEKRVWKKPGEVYQSTERLKSLLAGLTSVQIVEDALDCLRGDGVRDLLEACGAARYLDLVNIGDELPHSEVERIRCEVGAERITHREPVEDYSLRGLEELLQLIAVIPAEDWAVRASLLWESLVDLLARRGRTAFLGTFRWYYYQNHQRTFVASFVRRLRETNWIPTVDGHLRKTEDVCFDETGWKDEPFLSNLLGFRPPVLRELAKEAGIDPDVLTLLKRLGVTSVDQVKALLGMVESDGPVADDSLSSRAHGQEDREIEQAATSTHSVPNLHSDGRLRIADNEDSILHDSGSSLIPSEGVRPQADGAPPFISYVAVSRDEVVGESGDADASGVLEAEELAIQYILTLEPKLCRAPKNQPGFDLYEPGKFDGPVRWIEVKAMSSSLQVRSVALSHTQFAFGLAQGEHYWLYIVENVRSPHPLIAKIQNPAGRARSFTFDRGWNSVAIRSDI